MPLFKWCKIYSVDIEEIDNHHKKLLNIINSLHVAFLNVDKSSSLKPFIEDLLAYSNYHFTAEEKYMAEIGYEDLERHKSMHGEFLQKILKVQQAENKNDIELAKELLEYLGIWLLHHVMEEDKKLSV